MSLCFFCHNSASQAKILVFHIHKIFSGGEFSDRGNQKTFNLKNPRYLKGCDPFTHTEIECDKKGQNSQKNVVDGGGGG